MNCLTKMWDGKSWIFLTFLVLLSLMGDKTITRTQSFALSVPNSDFSYLSSILLNRFKRQEEDDYESSGEGEESSGEGQDYTSEGDITDVVSNEDETSDQQTIEEILAGTLEQESSDALLENSDDELITTTTSSTAVLEAPPSEDPSTTPTPPNPCSLTDFGCCSSNDSVPAHGFNGEGCCMLSEFGCCPDMIYSAPGINNEGCSCTETDYGCCPDNVTAARGSDNLGCGCSHSPFGCCPDQVTISPGADQEGCPCHTFEFGCCPDGETKAQGSNLEGCEDCSTTEFGCCPDNFTPASDGEGCGCAGSEHGCCPDGETEATGPEFEGCGEFPGQECSKVKVEEKNCANANFSVKWWFDMDYGGCSRFWLSDCPDEENDTDNRFDSEFECESYCTRPVGSGRCYLPKMTGPCKGSQEMFYFDRKWNKCMEFSYGGCLGNINRFKTIEECQESCLRTPDNVAVCAQPYEPGPCRGTYERWYYDGNDGFCKAMNYTGCMGNANRFMTESECDNSCKHESKLVRAKIVCSLPRMLGQECLGDRNGFKIAKWYFDRVEKVCKPFYYRGCGGNDNKFDSWEECEEKCPNTFPPEVDLLNKVLVIEEEFSALINVTIEANPPPTIAWQKDGEEAVFDERIIHLDNGSIHISTAKMDDSGTWTIIADNGLGQKARKQVTLKVFPSRMDIEVNVGKDKQDFEQGEEIRLTCSVTGYPIPSIKWYRNNIPLQKSTRFNVDDQDNTLVITKTSTIDTGSYSCRARNIHETVDDTIQIFVKKPENVEQCDDSPTFANCDLIVKAGFCSKNPFYSKFCCASCTEAGQPLYEPKAEDEQENEVTEESEDENTESEDESAQDTTESEYEASGEESDESSGEELVESESEYGNYDYDESDDVQEEYETADGEVAEDLPDPEY